MGKIFGERVRQRRIEMKLTQVALAKAAGITQPTLSSIELGHTREVEAKPIIVCCAGVRVPTDVDVVGNTKSSTVVLMPAAGKVLDRGGV